MMSFFSKLKTNNYHTDKRQRERMHAKVEKEDFLLSQIDEFRDKAKQLQGLLSSKESKVKELQSLVDEREGKAQRLQSILNERKQEADKINRTVQEQIDGLIVKVEDKIDDLNGDIKTSVAENLKESSSKTDEMKSSLEEMKTMLEEMKNELGEKVHDEDVKCYRNIQSLFEDFSTKIDKVDNLDDRIGSVKGYVKCLTWFSIVNFIVLVGFILYQLGVFF